MKVLLLGVTAFILYNSSTSLKYYSEGLDDKIILSGLKQWNLSNINYVKVDNPSNANIYFKKTTQLSVSNRYGESNYYEIRINSKYKFTNKELTNLISHEFGHYLSLSHNTNQYSIMNDKTKLAKKAVTPNDTACVHFLPVRLLVAKFIGTIYQYSR